MIINPHLNQERPCAVHPCHPAPGRTCHIAGAQDKLVSGWMELGDRVTSLVWQKVVEMLEDSGSLLERGQVNTMDEAKLPSPVHSTSEVWVV